MNITMNRAELLHAVRRSAAIAPTSSPLESLTGVCLEADAAKKSLVLTATNLEITPKQRLACDAQEDDALAIDARLLAGMLEKLPGDTVRLWRDAKGDQLKVWSGDAKYNVSVWERGSYPKAEIPAVTNLVRASGIPSTHLTALPPHHTPSLPYFNYTTGIDYLGLCQQVTYSTLSSKSRYYQTNKYPISKGNLK